MTPEALEQLAASTIRHYELHAEDFRRGTWHHDVTQNVDALLRYLDGPSDILDLGCGPGRDLVTFRDFGHRPIGLDAAVPFVEMARAASGCEVWQQDFLALDLPEGRFDGIFANAVLFHVPRQELPRVLAELRETLRPEGVLFCSNPRGPDVEQQNGLRFGCYLTFDTWSALASEAGFELLEHYYRPPGRPREQQPWLATVWRARSQ